MTRVTPCDECGDRERVGFQRDGVCRDCRGVETKTRNHRYYVSPDRRERNCEALAHREQENRARTIQDTRGQE